MTTGANVCGGDAGHWPDVGSDQTWWDLPTDDHDRGSRVWEGGILSTADGYPAFVGTIFNHKLLQPPNLDTKIYKTLNIQITISCMI